MDNLQTKSDRLAALITAFLCVAAGAGGLFYSDYSASTPVTETVKVQILSLESEADPPALGDPDGGMKEETVEPPEVKEEPEPAPKIVKPEAVKKVVKKEEPPQKKNVKKPVQKKKKNNDVKKKVSEVRQSAVTTDGKGNGNKKGTPQGTAAAKGTGASGGQIYKNAFSSLLSRVSSLKEYPSRARRQGLEGRCVLSFKVNSGGIVTAAAVTQKSGQVLLDSACKRLGDKVVGFDTGAKGGDFNVKVPVNYKLVD